MLDMGFADDIDSILQVTPEERQTVLFSATMPARINALARKYQRDPVRIQIDRGDTQPGTALVRQSAYMVQRSHKPAALGRILDIEAPKATLVFCRTRTEVDQLTETMNGRGYRAEALARRHGPAAARSGDGPAPRRYGGAARGHRRGCAWARRRHADPRRQLRRAIGCGELRAPHRSRWPSRSPRRGHHACRATRAAAAVQHREVDEAEDRDRAGARPSPICGPVRSSRP